MVLDLSKPKIDKDLDYIPNRNPNAGFKPRPKKLRKLGGGPPTIRKPKNFEKALQRLNETGKLSLDDFSSAADIGAFIDWCNETKRKSEEKYYHNEILEVSKLLARIQARKMIVMQEPKRDKI